MPPITEAQHEQLEARNRTRRNLRAWMKGRISNQELANELGFSPVYVSYLRTGKRDISDAFCWRFTSRFGPDAAAEIFGDLPHGDAPAADGETNGHGTDAHLESQRQPLLA